MCAEGMKHYMRQRKGACNLCYEGVRNMSEDKENILLESIKQRLRELRANPAKVLLLPPLCAGYAMILGALYVNAIVYGAYVYKKGKKG